MVSIQRRCIVSAIATLSHLILLTLTPKFSMSGSPMTGPTIAPTFHAVTIQYEFAKFSSFMLRLSFAKEPKQRSLMPIIMLRKHEKPVIVHFFLGLQLHGFRRSWSQVDVVRIGSRSMSLASTSAPSMAIVMIPGFKDVRRMRMGQNA